MSGSGLLPCNLTRNPIPSVVNPCCNQRRIWRGPEPWGRQCDDAISLKELLFRLLYLLIAVGFATLFTFVGLLLPDAFKGVTFDDNPALAKSVFYLSFVTLTSTGYGDIVPLHPVARSLCNLESVIGQLYVATLLAWLVTLELRQAIR